MNSPVEKDILLVLEERKSLLPELFSKLCRGGIGKRQSNQPGLFGIFDNMMNQFMNQQMCLSGTRSSIHKYDSGITKNGFFLLFVEAVEIVGRINP